MKKALCLFLTAILTGLNLSQTVFGQMATTDSPLSTPQYFNFQSVDDLIKAYENRFADELRYGIDVSHFYLDEENFNEWLDRGSLYVPYSKGAEVSSRLISVSADSFNFNTPWVNFSTGTVSIGYGFLDESLIKGAKENECSWVISQIYPDFLTSGNVINIHDDRLQLSNREVKTLVCRNELIRCEMIFFVYDDIFVRLTATGNIDVDMNYNLMDYNFIKDLSFEKIDIRPQTAQTATQDPVIYGDLTGAGRPNIESVMMMSKYLSQPAQNSLTDRQKLAADIDGDGRVTLLDLCRIIRIVLQTT